MAFGIVFLAGFFSALFFALVDGLDVSVVVLGVAAVVVVGVVVAAGAAVAAGGVVCASASGVCTMSASVAAAANKCDLCIRTSNMTDPQ
jgi:hypothetical protein